MDVILNHMAGGGREGIGSGGSSFKTDDGNFPGVPFTMPDFNDCKNCPGGCSINRYEFIIHNINSATLSK